MSVLKSAVFIQVSIYFCQHVIIKDDPAVDLPVVQIGFDIRDADNGVDRDI